MSNIKNIEIAASYIKNGKVVAFPTETVYGLGANAFNPTAVAKIFELKERPSFDPLIVHIADIKDIEKLCSSKNELVYKLAEKFWPGPLTIVLEKNKTVPDIVTSGLPTVGIRMPNNKIALDLILKSKCPIAAPSANKFGQLSPVNAKHVIKQLPNVDYVLDGGNTDVGIESTIIALSENICHVLRPGFITIEDIENAIPNTFIFNTSKPDKILSSGLLKSHYSPKKPLFLINDKLKIFPKNSGIILHHKLGQKINAEKILYTSANMNTIEIAANLFSILHKFEDDPDIDQIFIETIEEKGLGIAIMDRIKKAAFQYNGDLNR